MPEKLSRPVMPEKRQLNANRFARTGRLLSFFKALLLAAFLIWLVLGGISAQIVSFIHFPQIPLAVVYTLILFVVYGVLSMPFDYYRGFVLAGRYGLSVRSFGSWLRSYFQIGLLSAILVIGVVVSVYLAISYLPDLWWAIVWGLLLVISLIFNLLLPGLLIPMFYKTQPLDNEDLERRFKVLAKKAGVSIKKIYKIEFSDKQTTANAALTGIGRAKRVLLSDTLLDDYSAEEIEAIIAHELGHIKKQDGTGIFLFQALILFAGLWITAVTCGILAQPLGFNGVGDISMLPLMMLVFAIINMVLTPVSNAVLRSFEMAADDFAIRLTENPAAFISMLTKLMCQNLGEVNPPMWVEFLLYDHPGYYRRLSYARSFIHSCN
jgi:STE24 endopeptidase